jgi:Family of unknown function (DUF5989)
MSDKRSDDFEKAAKRASPGIAGDIWHFLRATKKWWLLPLIVILLTFGGIMLLSSTAVAPFIYTLF